MPTALDTVCDFYKSLAAGDVPAVLSLFDAKIE
jgi:hypothetical protein